MEKISKDLTNALVASTIITELIKDMDEPTFGATICTSIENWCDANNVSVTEIADKINVLIHTINGK